MSKPVISCGMVLAILYQFLLPNRVSAALEDGFPKDAGVVNVKDFGAKGDGATDDSEAIGRALEKTGLIWFPPGTYLVSKPLVPPARKGSAPARRVIQGAGSGVTRLKLVDRCAGFEDAEQPVHLLKISWGVAQAFRNGIRDITLDVGEGNPGAVGCGFMASNQGGMHGVEIVAGIGSGAVGLDFDVGDNGPLIVRNLKVTGFQTGVRLKYGNAFTFENIELRDIRGTGIASEHAVSIVRNLHYEGGGPVLRDAWSGGTVIDGLDATGKGEAALEIKGRLVGKNLRQKGYAAMVSQGKSRIGEAQMSEYVSHPVLHALEDGPKRPLNLPVRELPEVAHEPPENWVNVMDFPPGKSGGAEDWGVALQAAIDSGARTVYFPRGSNLAIRSEVIVRGKLERLIGMEGEFAKASEAKTAPLLVVADGEAKAVVVERFDSLYSNLSIKHTGKRDLVLSSMAFENIEKAPGSGDLFLCDTIVERLDVREGRCSARQLNCEYIEGRPHIINHGGDLWIFGFKNEGDGVKAHTAKGARTEFYGYVLSNKATPSLSKPPMFTVEDGLFSAMLIEGVLRGQPTGRILVEKRGGKEGVLLADDVPHIANRGAAIALMTAGAE